MLKPTDKKPYECPVCKGEGWYAYDKFTCFCERCNGTGVIWATDKEAEGE